ncbi:hypothetical protein GCM10023194_28570 [Planotetraspora phitsanulokensis]|uniref:Uncharacterized protein n=1 Tax=Planotetraspora phitsanulokensis TaxID=575192 RepID=A0A8J3XCG8_9ACTN|nr:hypothetical protein Pph01_10080 [Planotetraspora phitsanulokensis]
MIAIVGDWPKILPSARGRRRHTSGEEEGEMRGHSNREIAVDALLQYSAVRRPPVEGRRVGARSARVMQASQGSSL